MTFEFPIDLDLQDLGERPGFVRGEFANGELHISSVVVWLPTLEGSEMKIEVSHFISMGLKDHIAEKAIELCLGGVDVRRVEGL